MNRKCMAWGLSPGTSTERGTRMVPVQRWWARLGWRNDVHRGKRGRFLHDGSEASPVCLRTLPHVSAARNVRPRCFSRTHPANTRPQSSKNRPNFPDCRHFAIPCWRDGIFRRSGRTSRSPWPNDDVAICLRGYPEMVSEFDFPAARGLDTGLPRSVCLRNARHFRVSGLPHPFSW